MKPEEMVRGGLYRFKHRRSDQPEVLKYIGHNWSGNGYWHQFEQEGKPGVWAEVLTSDLWMIEEAEGCPSKP